MRRIITFNRVSADGYFASTDGGLDWAIPDEELDQAAVSGMSGTGTMIFGRSTYDAFESFWPHALDDAAGASDPHRPGRRTPAIRAMATWINEATKIVFSTTRKEVTWKNSQLFRAIDPRQIEKLKQEPGKDIMIFGSGTVVSELTRHGLIDEYQFVVVPILLGGGKSLVSGLSKRTKVDLVETKRYPSGTVVNRYARAK